MTELPVRRRAEKEEANKRKGEHEGGELRAKAQRERQNDWEDSAPLSLPKHGKKRRKKVRKRILGEQLNDTLKKGEAREAHRLSRTLAGRRMGARRRHLARILAKRRCSHVTT